MGKKIIVNFIIVVSIFLMGAVVLAVGERNDAEVDSSKIDYRDIESSRDTAINNMQSLLDTTGGGQGAENYLTPEGEQQIAGFYKALAESVVDAEGSKIALADEKYVGMLTTTFREYFPVAIENAIAELEKTKPNGYQEAIEYLRSIKNDDKFREECIDRLAKNSKITGVYRSLISKVIRGQAGEYFEPYIGAIEEWAEEKGKKVIKDAVRELFEMAISPITDEINNWFGDIPIFGSSFTNFLISWVENGSGLVDRGAELIYQWTELELENKLTETVEKNKNKSTGAWNWQAEAGYAVLETIQPEIAQLVNSIMAEANKHVTSAIQDINKKHGLNINVQNFTDVFNGVQQYSFLAIKEWCNYMMDNHWKGTWDDIIGNNSNLGKFEDFKTEFSKYVNVRDENGNMLLTDEEFDTMRNIIPEVRYG